MPITGTYKISATTTLTALKDITITAYYQPIPDPKGVYVEWTELAAKDSGGVRGVGYPMARWTWGFMRPEWRDALKSYCAGASANVYIQTRTNSSSAEFATFSAVMNWPDERDIDAHRRMNFSIEFTNLVPFTP